MIYTDIKQQVLIHIWQNRKSFQHTSNYAEQLIMMYSICYKIFDSRFVCVLPICSIYSNTSYVGRLVGSLDSILKDAQR